MYNIYKENENIKKSIIVGKITGNSEEVKPIFYQKQKSTARRITKKWNGMNWTQSEAKKYRETIFYHLFHY